MRYMMELSSPEALEKEARAIMRSYGVSVERRSTEYLLLGRGAFAAAQYIAPAGIQQAEGILVV